MAKASAQKAEVQRIKPTDDGLHLTGSILWFDSVRNGDLSFLSSANFPHRNHGPQVLATEETLRIFEAFSKKPNALVCQYNRPFSIGRLKMELLPSGSVLGGASLYVENGATRILYAPQLQTQRIPTVRQMQLKRAQTLVLGADHPDPSFSLPNRKKEKDRLVETIQHYIKDKIYPTILVKPIGTAQEINKLLSEHQIPVAVHSTIFKVNRTYDAFGSQIGSYSAYSSRSSKDKVLLLPLLEKTTLPIRRPLPDAPVLTIEEDPHEIRWSSSPEDQKHSFFLNLTSDGPELKTVVSLVHPKELYIIGPFAKRYAEEFKDLAPKVKPLFPNDQPTLF